MSLHLDGVSKAYGHTSVLRDVSLDVPAGSRIALVGASGSGKTTLLRLIAGFVEPDAGTITLNGRTLAGPHGSVPAHRRGIGYVAQDGALFPHLSVARNVAFGLPRRERTTARVHELLDLASLDRSLADRMPHELSGGQQQRVALARALAQRPSVILLDEPFSALDTGLRAQTRNAVQYVLERSGVTAVLVTHDQAEALSFGHQVGVIADGRLVQAGAPADVFDAPVSPGVAEFLGDMVMVPAVPVTAPLRIVGHPTGTMQVNCALGCVAVRHDHSGGAKEVSAMVRPDQLRLNADAPDGGNATVLAVKPAGSSAEVRLRIGVHTPAGIAYSADTEAGLEVVHKVPLHEAGRYVPGSAIDVAVDGGVVLYPTPVS
ncbi:MAG TPA: ABC transporter ATP-binding protein [Candidatus Lumbricidophila sp.]|nr:ABC transporter ATP-binding protein [Candidatus Lumbricidophila sp.]